MSMAAAVGGFKQFEDNTGIGAAPTTTGRYQPMGQQYGGSTGTTLQLQQPPQFIIQPQTTQPQTTQPQTNQPQGNTGVGAAPTTTGQYQPMGQQYGGKGGGTGAAPQLQQPSQASTNQPQTTQPQTTQPQPPQRYQPTGGNVFGYNMGRLASRMDPSASLPGANIQQQPQYQPPQYQPEYQPQQGGYQGSLGGKGGGRGAYEPQFFDEYYNQPSPMFRPQYRDITTGINPPLAGSEIRDPGEAIYTMDPGRTATGVGTQSYVPTIPTLTNPQIQQAAADKAAADKAAADKAAAEKAAADKAAAAKAAAAKKKSPFRLGRFAVGGSVVAHKGMTSNLKKQLKNK